MLFFIWPRCSLADAANICTKFIYGLLKVELRLPERKRERRYADKNYLYHFARQFWMADWFSYQKPLIRVDDWALILTYVYSSVRVGEYIESFARKGSGRGLHYKVRW
jgi:hypothetical protein